MNTLTVLSGANVSGSCYLAQVNSMRILFDCGVKPNNAYCDHVEVPDPESIDIIFISHAHMDHMGSVAYMASACKNAKIYVTAMTAEFIKYQLSSTIANYIGANTPELQYHNRLLCQFVMNRLEIVDYGKKYSYTNREGATCYFAFFHAGHMPGAAMIYIRVNDYKLLYSGDFSSRETPLTGAYDIPKLPVNTLILCALHANDPDYVLRANSIKSSFDSRFRRAFAVNTKVIVPATQLSKGLEMLSIIDDLFETGVIEKCPVYLCETIWNLAKSYEQRSETFRLPSYIRRLSQRPSATPDSEKEIILSDDTSVRRMFGKFEEIRPDFSLHTDFAGLIELIERVNADEVYVVHVNNLSLPPCLSDPAKNDNCSKIHYTENNEIYKLIDRR